MAGISFTAADFVAKFREGHFASAPLSATGLVKLPDDERPKSKGKETAITALQFAHGSDCDHWVTIPLTLIDRVDFLRVVRCKDHNHPLVTLIFSVPQSPEAQTFHEIAKLASAASSNPSVTRGASALTTSIPHDSLQAHAFLTPSDMPEFVRPNPDGQCPDGYRPWDRDLCRRALGR
jgi:hypothetical protein